MDETLERLNKILEMYHIGKKPLSKLFGWGETTVINQLNSGSLSHEFAEKINAVWESPYYFAEILEQNKRKITNVAYRKAKKAVDERIIGDKSAHLVLYLARITNNDIAPYQLVASLFYAQAVSLIKNGYPLINEDILYKPRNYVPYPEIYSKLTRSGVQTVSMTTDMLSSEEKDLIANVNKLLSGYSPNAIKVILKSDRTSLVNRHRAAGLSTEAEATDGIQISLSEFQAYCVDESKKAGISGIEGLKAYLDDRLKKGKGKNK